MKPREPADPRRLHAPLRRWYRRHHRPLPRRLTRVPYAIWISETMLQQTRVETVLRYWPRFLRRFPTMRHLARAREDSVLALWSGLGYYTRARSLHRTARLLVERHGAELPADVERLRALPGFGPYTAGAVASIAFGVPAPVVDGNVARVLARLFAVPGDPRSPAVARRLWSLARGLVPRRAAGEWNQALMELGAIVCTARSPGCSRCPVRRSCAAFARGTVGRFPGARVRAPAVQVRRAVAVVRRDGHVLLVRREKGRLLRRLWEFPEVGELPKLGLRVRLGKAPRGTIRHSILDRRIETRVFTGTVRSVFESRNGCARWFPPRRLRALPLSAAALRISLSFLQPASYPPIET